MYFAKVSEWSIQCPYLWIARAGSWNNWGMDPKLQPGSPSCSTWEGVTDTLSTTSRKIRVRSVYFLGGITVWLAVDLFLITSCNMFLSRVRSATDRLSLTFSSSSWRRWRTPLAPSSPFFSSIYKRLPAKFLGYYRLLQRQFHPQLDVGHKSLILRWIGIFSSLSSPFWRELKSTLL